MLSKKLYLKFCWRKECKTQPSAMTLPTKMNCWSQQMIFRTWLTAWHVLAISGNWKCMNLTAQPNIFVFHKKYVSQELQFLFQYFAELLKWTHLSKKYLQLSRCALEVRHVSHINESVLTLETPVKKKKGILLTELVAQDILF